MTRWGFFYWAFKRLSGDAVQVEQAKDYPDVTVSNTF